MKKLTERGRASQHPDNRSRHFRRYTAAVALVLALVIAVFVVVAYFPGITPWLPDKESKMARLNEAATVRDIARQEGTSGAAPVLVDASVEKPDLEYGESKVVNSAAGNYREVGRQRYDRIGYFFETSAVYDLIRVSVEYPDDKPRMAEFSLIASDDTDGGNYQPQGALGTGYITGFTYPLTNQTKNQSFYFHLPFGRKFALIVTTLKDDAPAAIKTLKVERIDLTADIPALPAAAIAPHRRSIGMFWEDPVMEMNFAGRLLPQARKDDDTQRWHDALMRQLAYLRRTGHNMVIYPVVWYIGALYQPSVEFASGRDFSRPHPKEFDKLMARAYSEAGVEFWPSLRNWQLPSLDSAVESPEAIRNGDTEDYVNTVTKDGKVEYFANRWHKGPLLNSLHPKVQKAYEDLIAEILHRIGSEPSVKGIALWHTIHSYPGYGGSSDQSYDDYTLHLFAKENALSLPAVTGPQRFSAWYRWVKEQHWDKWLAWRRDKQTQSIKRLAELIDRTKPGAKLQLMVKYPIPTIGIGQSVDKPSEYYRDIGLDLEALSKDPHIVISRIIRGYVYPRLLARDMSLKDRLLGKDKFLWHRHQLNYDAAWQQPFLGKAAGVVEQYDYFEYNLEQEGIPLFHLPEDWGDAKETSWHDAALKGGGRNALDQLTQALALFDARFLAHGGFCLGPQGMETLVQDFAAVYRSLPDVPFETTLLNQDNKIVARTTVTEAARWIYAVNATAEPRDITVNVNFAARLERLGNHAEALTVAPDRPLRVSLQPYELAAWSTRTAQSN